MQINSDYYSAVFDYYQIAKLLSIAEANFQPPSQRQPLYNQKIDISNMSSGTLSYAAANSTNCPPQALPPTSDVTLSATSSPQQNMGDMAMAAATAPGDVQLSECTSCPESNGTISGDAQYTEGLGITSSSPDIPQLDESDQVVAETKNMLVSSLLLKPYSSTASKIANADGAVASMSTPQSLQDSGNSSISPLDMLIAALDPQKSSQLPLSNKPPASILGQCTSAIICDSADGAGNGAEMGVADCSAMGSTLTDNIWDSAAAAASAAADSAQNQYPNTLWKPEATAASNASPNMAAHPSNAVMNLLCSSEGSGNDADYQNLGAVNDYGKPISMQQSNDFGRDIRRGSYPPGIKRPYSDFEQLLSAADMYGSIGDQNSHAAKHARHDSLIDDKSGTLSATMDSAVAAAAAAAAAAASVSISYNNPAFPYSTKRSTAPMTSPQEQETMRQQNYFNGCFDPFNPAAGANISLDAAGMPMIPGAPQMVYPSMGMSSAPLHAGQDHDHSRSLSYSSQMDSYPPVGIVPLPPISNAQHVHDMASDISAATSYHQTQPGYYYNDLLMPSTGAYTGINSMAYAATAIPTDNRFARTPPPIPSIPGVTTSPKEKPRRISVPNLTPTDEEKSIGDSAYPRRQNARSTDDLYTPMWVRNAGQLKEGFCDTCVPGKWLQLKNSAYWYHKQFAHGISSVSGRPFIRPLEVRHYNDDVIEGLCHQCYHWVPIANSKRRNSVLWFRHAHKCHIYNNKPKPKRNYSKFKGTDGNHGMAAFLPSPQGQISMSDSEYAD
ncbi:hypothetical protein LPJ66_004414 [Kickxella alabastrina]|uniref:Uncharacterized protein n=1 Tax=Kickxella alabastrina TaxID=61397 RepID=A0ACC1II14_9FUNG|nr:hypothetical protein LPJ66_004414 [Kickxella alabastrina]